MFSVRDNDKTRRIHFEDRCLTICYPDNPTLSDPNAIRFEKCDNAAIHQLVTFMKDSPSLNRIFIPTEDIDGTYRCICSEFKEVNAGGGLVSNIRGDILMIRRNGLWDLPKGHQDPGEDISVTALREVREETGLDDIMLRDLICITDHCYLRDGKWHLKHTWWYDMLYTSPCERTPQTEEDISKAAWIPKSGIQDYLQHTYPSICEVFRGLE